jgi:uncharacterized protein YndB with AHSA1/START domain
MFQTDPNVIQWKLHLKSSPARVYEFLATDQGRAAFWAESAVENDGAIDFVFPNGWTWRGKILERVPNEKYVVEYFGNSLTTFELCDDGQGGTDLFLSDANVPMQDRNEVIAGWVSVLMQLKASVDFGVDLRNHDSLRTWDQGYAEN